ncbi:MAG: GxxExxY protein [Brachymonas sp.]|nr:GxxExxY protein [Brachymonas sp.]
MIGAAVEVQRVLGAGVLESAYAAALSIELDERGLSFQREVPISTSYKGQNIGVVFRADFIVENCVIVELKAIEAVTEAHKAQLLTYLRLTGIRLGLLLNFHDFSVARGTKRVVNNFL